MNDAETVLAVRIVGFVNGYANALYVTHSVVLSLFRSTTVCRMTLDCSQRPFHRNVVFVVGSPTCRSHYGLHRIVSRPSVSLPVCLMPAHNTKRKALEAENY